MTINDDTQASQPSSEALVAPRGKVPFFTTRVSDGVTGGILLGGTAFFVEAIFATNYVPNIFMRVVAGGGIGAFLAYMNQSADQVESHVNARPDF